MEETRLTPQHHNTTTPHNIAGVALSPSMTNQETFFSHTHQKRILYPRFHCDYREASAISRCTHTRPTLSTSSYLGTHKDSCQRSWHDGKLGCALIQPSGTLSLFCHLVSVGIARNACLVGHALRSKSIRGESPIVSPCRPAAGPNSSGTLLPEPEHTQLRICCLQGAD